MWNVDQIDQTTNQFGWQQGLPPLHLLQILNSAVANAGKEREEGKRGHTYLSYLLYGVLTYIGCQIK